MDVTAATLEPWAARAPKATGTVAEAAEATPDQCAEYARRMLDKKIADLEGASGNLNDKLSGAARYLGKMVGAGWITRDVVYDALEAVATGWGGNVAKAIETLNRRLDLGISTPAEGLPAVAPPRTRYAEWARLFLDQSGAILLYWREEFYEWDGARYSVLPHGSIETAVGLFLEGSVAWEKGKLSPYDPNRSAVDEVVVALGRACHLDARSTTPSWLSGVAGWTEPGDLISFPNGLLDWRTAKLWPQTPDLFGIHACGFDYDAAAPPPTLWLKFLGEVFPDDEAQVRLLQEVMGYCLVPDLSFEKIFGLFGPRRSGKGTISRVLRGLMTDGAAVAVTGSSFATDFGLSHVIGRQLAVIEDMRLGKNTDKAMVAERLLTISGRGDVSIGRKYLSAWSGSLSVKFLIISNDLPAFADDSGALASRFISIQTRESFEDREDRGLSDKLAAERPGILIWALEGLRRLYHQDRFTATQESRGIRSRLAIAASQVQAFVADCCEHEAGAEVRKASVYGAYKEWTKRNDVRALDNAHFAEALLSAGNGKITTSKPLRNGAQVPHFVGLKLIKPYAGDRF
jgi:putative DNA primase/helicase